MNRRRKLEINTTPLIEGIEPPLGQLPRPEWITITQEEEDKLFEDPWYKNLYWQPLPEEPDD